MVKQRSMRAPLGRLDGARPTGHAGAGLGGEKLSREKGENKRPEFLCDKHGWSLLLVAILLDMSTIMAHFEDAFWAGPQDLGR